MFKSEKHKGLRRNPQALLYEVQMAQNTMGFDQSDTEWEDAVVVAALDARQALYRAANKHNAVQHKLSYYMRAMEFLGSSRSAKSIEVDLVNGSAFATARVRKKGSAGIIYYFG